jgi:hypothetical protein
MRQVFVLLCILLFTSCSIVKPIKIAGIYNSSCKLYGKPDLEVKFNSDSTFVYKRPHLEENITGEWVIKRDTLMLYSDKFINQSKDELAPKYKYTELEGKDAYLVKGKKLLVITKTGFRKDCYLQKEEK